MSVRRPILAWAWPSNCANRWHCFAGQGRSNNAPYVEVRDALPGAPAATTIAYLMDLVHRARRGLLIVGPNDDPRLAEPLAQLAEYLGYPVLADPLSQLRCGDS